jgi:hypothetical protein
MFLGQAARVAEGELNMKKKKPPPVDIRKVIRAAAEAALEEPEADVRPKKRRHSGRRAVMLGAGLVAAGRLLAGGRGGALLGSVQHRLAGLGVEVPGKVPVEPELDADELVDEPVEEIDDLGEDGPDAEGDKAAKGRKAGRRRGS